MNSQYVTVVGAANVDITATPLRQYVAGDSNPSQVEIGFGGVGRNIAHNLSLLGNDVRLITVFGDDAISLSLRDDCRRVGITVDPFYEIPGARSNYFICVNDEHGEMQAGAADMELMRHLPPAMIEMQLPAINSGAALVADCNPEEDVLRFLVENCRVPLYVDAPSQAKSHKIKSILAVNREAPLILKVNRAEAHSISGVDGSVDELAAWFLVNGVSRIFITLGSDGVYCAQASASLTLPARETTILNTTGAGDAFMAAVVHAELRGAGLEEATSLGLAAAAITLNNLNAVSDDVKLLINDNNK